MSIRSLVAARPARNHPAYWAFVGHRLSGLCLALFLPAHFIMLAQAFEGAQALDDALAYTDLPLVKIAEGGLVVFLALHLFFGLRILALEFLPWPADGRPRLSLIAWGIGAAGLAGLAFAAAVL